MYSDFRRIYGVSAEKIGTEELSWNEAFHLILGLFKDTGSLLYGAVHEITPLSQEGYLLIAVQNSVIDTIAVKPQDKEKKAKAKISFPKSTKKVARKQVTKVQAAKRFAHVQIAEE